MGRRTRKKNKKIEKKGIKIHKHFLKSGTYKSADKFMEKARANAQVGKLFTPIVEDYASKTEQAIIRNTIDHNPIDDIKVMEELIEHCFEPTCRNCFIFATTGRCAVCNMALTHKYPEDYPDEWKFCCFCQPNARMLIEGTLKPITDKLKKLYDKITLVKGE